jgi:hypothetical protein
MTHNHLYWLPGQEDMSEKTSKFTPKPDTGTLFENRFKKNDSHPDYTGTYAMPDGTVREFAAWHNENYISVKFSDQYESSKRSA